MSIELAHGEITEAIIGSAFEVHHVLGYGFLEAVYRNAMAAELQNRGFRAEMEKRLEVLYTVDLVHEYCVQQLKEFNGKKLKCTTREGLDLEDENERKKKLEELKAEIEPLSIV